MHGRALARALGQVPAVDQMVCDELQRVLSRVLLSVGEMDLATGGQLLLCDGQSRSGGGPRRTTRRIVA